VILRAIEEEGYAAAPALLTPEETASTEEALQGVSLAKAGTRNLLELSWCRELVQHIKSHAAIRAALPSSPVAVQCTLFEKSEKRNWLVALHQDLSIPVKERVEHPEFGVWSRKEGEDYVQPPTALLEQLLAVRLHIDDCDSSNGPLRVVPGSHRHGRLGDAMARRLRDAAGEVTCAVGSGGALLLRPLLLHASSKATSPRRRRVLHFLFGPESISYGLRWQHVV
jgi:ectoine hydroxylase-related dioxygenase (phytanoyl-CoA dioxygenase family)